ncbi:putative signal peptide protein [Puccinia sorghi]|uniref:Putative signal peptide protein n=1 Tax=Puccinia sorghi TaxID=27349 RepID=A0A0L6UNI4_9BASI|nr:putative signal peptide protein [Puccinia sorghi]
MGNRWSLMTSSMILNPASLITTASTVPRWPCGTTTRLEPCRPTRRTSTSTPAPTASRRTSSFLSMALKVGQKIEVIRQGRPAPKPVPSASTSAPAPDPNVMDLSAFQKAPSKQLSSEGLSSAFTPLYIPQLAIYYLNHNTDDLKNIDRLLFVEFLTDDQSRENTGSTQSKGLKCLGRECSLFWSRLSRLERRSDQVKFQHLFSQVVKKLSRPLQKQILEYVLSLLDLQNSHYWRCCHKIHMSGGGGHKYVPQLKFVEPKTDLDRSGCFLKVKGLISPHMKQLSIQVNMGLGRVMHFEKRVWNWLQLKKSHSCQTLLDAHLFEIARGPGFQKLQFTFHKTCADLIHGYKHSNSIIQPSEDSEVVRNVLPTKKQKTIDIENIRTALYSWYKEYVKASNHEKQPSSRKDDAEDIVCISEAEDEDSLAFRQHLLAQPPTNVMMSKTCFYTLLFFFSSFASSHHRLRNHYMNTIKNLDDVVHGPTGGSLLSIISRQHCKKPCLQLTCSMLQPSCHPNSTFLHMQIFWHSQCAKVWSNNRSFQGVSACQLQAVEQVFFAVQYSMGVEHSWISHGLSWSDMSVILSVCGCEVVCGQSEFLLTITLHFLHHYHHHHLNNQVGKHSFITVWQAQDISSTGSVPLSH